MGEQTYKGNGIKLIEELFIQTPFKKDTYQIIILDKIPNRMTLRRKSFDLW